MRLLATNSKPIRTTVHAAVWLFHFVRYVVRHFVRQRGMQIASSLAYATLLSLVPLLTVMFAFPGELPGFSKLSQIIQDFLFTNFVPEFGNTVQDYLGRFSENASRLTLGGATVLVLIALLLMATIDNALNLIWRVRNRRSPAARFLVYWAMLTLGPLLVGAGLLSTSYVLSLPVVSDVEETIELQRRLLSVLPFLTTSAAFTLMYIVVPNCHVTRSHALIGGVLAALLFELAKYGFGVYVRSVPTEQIYGAIAVIPLFLVWIYLSWAIVLFGAHVAFCASEFSLREERAGRGERQWTFEDAFRLLHAFWLAQKEGRPLRPHELRKQGLHLPQHHLHDILACLKKGSWIDLTADGGWLLTRDMDDVTLFDLHRVVPRPLPGDGAAQSGDPRVRGLEEFLAGYRERLAEGLNVPLGELLRNST